jgi:hypothetical protein
MATECHNEVLVQRGYDRFVTWPWSTGVITGRKGFKRVTLLPSLDVPEPERSGLVKDGLSVTHWGALLVGCYLFVGGPSVLCAFMCVPGHHKTPE